MDNIAPHSVSITWVSRGCNSPIQDAMKLTWFQGNGKISPRPCVCVTNGMLLPRYLFSVMFPCNAQYFNIAWIKWLQTYIAQPKIWVCLIHSGTRHVYTYLHFSLLTNKFRVKSLAIALEAMQSTPIMNTSLCCKWYLMQCMFKTNTMLTLSMRGRNLSSSI